MFSQDGAAIICTKVESAKSVGKREWCGWLHRLRDDPFKLRSRVRRVKIDAHTDHPVDFDALETKYEANLGPHVRGMLAHQLGVSDESLTALHVGWSDDHQAYTFPMVDANGKVRGIRLRSPDGKKWSVKGGREGLFVPTRLFANQLVIGEGPTDCAALFDHDFFAVGRPSCMGGSSLLVDLVCSAQPHEVAIVADADAPGQRGARNLAARLVGYVPGMRIVIPPNGAKDARDWVRLLQSAHLSWERRRLEIQQAIESAPVMTLSYSRRALA
jgi:hypothetical protein